MFTLFVVGLLLLAAWIAWALYIVQREKRVSVSLVLKVENGEEYLDPFLRLVCHLFRQTEQVELAEVWVLATDDGGEARRIVNRLQQEYPLFRFRSHAVDERDGLAQSYGQVVWILDLVHRLTPEVALQALSSLLNQPSPMPPGTSVLVSSP